jgi:hypothetical protein
MNRWGFEACMVDARLIDSFGELPFIIMNPNASSINRLI